MHINKIKNILLFIVLPFFLGCEAEIDQHIPDAGAIDLTAYVAVGNSLTAGYTDGELFRSGQEYSMANIMAGQFMHAGLESFKQPLMKDEIGFGGRMVLAEVDGAPFPVPMPGNPDPANFENIYQTDGPFHNLGVPGATAQHLLFEGYGTLNPYFGRFAANPVTSSVIADALALQPSFFTLWIGSNDILGYALKGGEGPGITPFAEFELYYQIILSELTAGGAKGAIANIVDIVKIPFFTTIPYNTLVLDDSQAAMLNAAYENMGATHITFAADSNAVVVVDTDHPAGLRQMEKGELILLTAMEGIGQQNWGSQQPMAPEYYLSLDQVDEIAEAMDNFNTAIRLLAETADVAYVDIRSSLKEAETGIYFDAIGFNTEYVTGGIFSLDGIHLTARGNVIVANEFIAAINRQYEASIPKAVIGNFPGIVFP